jgi:hypothetical protein
MAMSNPEKTDWFEIVLYFAVCIGVLAGTVIGLNPDVFLK